MPTLRERKKADTRDAIRAAAVELFWTDGYEATTMDAVAEAADVSVRTVFRYFPTKEDLVFDEVDGDLADLADLLASRPADEPLMAGLRAVVEVLAGRDEVARSADARLAPLLHDEPALRRRYLETLDHVEETVRDWARTRLDAGPDDLRPAIVAACVVAVQRVVVEAIAGGDPRPLPEVLRPAMEYLTSGFGDLDP